MYSFFTIFASRFSVFLAADFDTILYERTENSK